MADAIRCFFMFYYSALGLSSLYATMTPAVISRTRR